MTDLKAFTDLEYELFTSLFLDYCIIGGMPAVVKAYIEKGTFEGSVTTQHEI